LLLFTAKIRDEIKNLLFFNIIIIKNISLNVDNYANLGELSTTCNLSIAIFKKCEILKKIKVVIKHDRRRIKKGI